MFFCNRISEARKKTSFFSLVISDRIFCVIFRREIEKKVVSDMFVDGFLKWLNVKLKILRVWKAEFSIEISVQRKKKNESHNSMLWTALINSRIAFEYHNSYDYVCVNY